jgi:hypothetical protein
VDLAADLIAGAALVVSIAGVRIARRSDRSAQKSADAAELSASAAARTAQATEARLAIEAAQRHDQQRPRLTGCFEMVYDGWHLTVTLSPGDMPLTALDLAIRPNQSVEFKRGSDAVVTPLLARDYAIGGERVGLQPGDSMTWLAVVSPDHLGVIQIDATCNRGDETWDIVISAEVREENESIDGTIY